jgi:DNA-binding YbaB/EbfC family protein
MFNMADLFGKMQEMQQRMEETKRQLGELRVTADSGGGMVTVTANGNREILSVRIDKDVVDPADPEMLEDLVTAAVNKALAEADRVAKERMAEVTKSMLPMGGIPGFDPSKFGL